MPTTTPFNNLITFSRGSNATVTGSNGLIQWAPNNLVTNSESFDAAAWAKSNVTVIANQDIGNGTLGPELVTNGAFTTDLSGWTLAGTPNPSWSAGGALMSGTSDLRQTLTTVAGAWYLLTFAVTGTFSSSFINVGTTNGGNDLLNIFIPTSGRALFRATTTTSFLRFLAASQTFTLDDISVKQIIPASGLAPDGTQTADTLITAAATGVVSSYSTSQNALWNTADTRTVSFYVKSSGLRYATIGVHNGAGFTTATSFDLQTGSVAASDTHPTYTTLGVASIQNVGGGWYRCAVPITGLDTSAKQPYIVGSSTFGGLYNRDVTGNGTSGILIWGAQLELGSTATTYNPTTVKNLLGFSEAFDNAAWPKTNTSIVTGAAANPVNNLFNAQKLMENTAAATQHFTRQNPITVPSAAVVTLSVYAKAGERRYIGLLEGYSNKGRYFDLQTGTVGNILVGAPTTSSITPVGSGWYRCSITTTAPATTVDHEIYLSADGASISYTGDGNSGVYIYGAQLSDSASLDPYVPTPGAAPSSTAFYGPRFDFDPVTRAPRGLLVEEQRTNIVTYSDQFNDPTWTKFLITVTANSTVSPDGTTNADTIASTGGGSSALRQIMSTASGTHTATIYAKAGTKTVIQFSANAFSWGIDARANFDLASGVLGTVDAGLTATITNVGNGWYRCSVAATKAATAGALLWCIVDSPTSAREAATTAGTLFVWGAQLEAGAFATSYIPTVASTVTRSADVALISGQNFAQWYGQPEGTFVIDYRQGEGTTARAAAVANDGTNNNTIELYIDGSTDATSLPFYGVYVGGAVQAALSFAAAAANSNHKMAGAYRTNDFAASVDGSSVATDTSGTLPTPTRLSIGANGPATGSFANGHIRSINFIPARAADFQLQALTAQSIVDYFYLQTAAGDQLIAGNDDYLYSLPILG